RYDDMMSAEVSMDLPLWQSNRQGPLITARKRVLDKVEAQREEAERLHRVELETDLAELDSAERQLTRLRTQAVPLAEQLVDLAQSRYRSGTGSLADLFEARRNLLMQQLRAIDLLEQSLATKARLSYLAAEETP
ncbi:MAG: TolC family protein, partial [Pseudomonadota bacterium]